MYRITEVKSIWNLYLIINSGRAPLKKKNKTQTQDPDKSTQPSKTKNEFLEPTHWKEIHNLQKG